MSRLSAQFFVNFVNSARLPCAARWGGWVSDFRIELPMALTQTVFLSYNMPVAISRLLVLSLEKACFSESMV